ncbi:MAG: hypothetical protein V3T15_06760, partial [Pseudomonadales bacterium]
MTSRSTREVELVEVRASERDILANLMQLYLYDTSEYNDDDMDADGRFSHGAYFDLYWREPERHPFF